MLDKLEQEISLMWKNHSEGHYVFISTGEVHNEFQRKGEIQKLLEYAQITNFHDYKPLFVKYDIPYDRKISNKRSKKPKNETCINWKTKSDDLFIKIYRKEGIQMMENKILNAFEKAFMYTIVPYVEFKTNCVIVSGEYPTLDELADLVGISVRKIKDVVKSLENKNIIKRYKDGLHKKIFVNPEYMCAGSIIEGEIPSFFIDKNTLDIFNEIENQ